MDQPFLFMLSLLLVIMKPGGAEKKMPGTENSSLSSKKHLGTKGFFGGPAEYRLNKSNAFPSVIRADQQGN